MHFKCLVVDIFVVVVVVNAKSAQRVREASRHVSEQHGRAHHVHTGGLALIADARRRCGGEDHAQVDHVHTRSLQLERSRYHVLHESFVSIRGTTRLI